MEATTEELEQWKRELSVCQNEALQLYLQALDMEQEGNINQAILLYRQSFRKDPYVEKVVVQMHRAAIETAQKAATEAAGGAVAGSSSSSHAHADAAAESEGEGVVEDFSPTLEPLLGSIEKAQPSKGDQTFQFPRKSELTSTPSSSSAAPEPVHRATSASKVQKKHSHAHAHPHSQQRQQRQHQQHQQHQPQRQSHDMEVETKETKALETAGELRSNSDTQNQTLLHFHSGGVLLVEPEKPVPAGCLHISRFPDEIMLHIFKFLGAYGVSALVPASRVCKKWCVYFNDQEVWRALCARSWPACYRVKAPMYHFNWRRMYSERPRVRHDGVYIAKITYLRQGMAEGSYYQPIHLVTYYRYLRFFPDSTVLSLCTPEPPSNVISQHYLKYGYKGVMKGSYRSLEHLHTGGRPHLEISTSVREREDSKYIYHMNFELYSTYQGGSNKIIWRNYTSTDPQGEFPTQYPLEQMGNYLFSRVRSYQ